MSRKRPGATKPEDAADLSPLESRVIEVLWKHGTATADEVRKALEPRDRLSDSSVRTLLRRMEAKRQVAHDRDGKRFVFRPLLRRPSAAAAAARKIIDTICGGKVSALIVGLLESEMLTPEELDAVRARIDAESAKEKAKDD